MPIEGLSTSRRLPRLGKIHLGFKDPAKKGAPTKTDYFVCPPEVQAVFEEKPKELRILIPVEDEEKWASQYYRCYSKTRGLICKGDGITAMRMIDTQTGAMADRDSKAVGMKEMACAGRKCSDYKIKCKEVMNLQFLLPEVPGLGVWQIDTSSRNSIININSMAELIKSIYKKIAMIPLLLTLEPKEVNNPDDGKKQIVFVLNLRVNMKLADLTLMARRQAEILELPIADDERPDLISPDFEPDVVEMPEGLEPITPENAEKLYELWGPKPKESETQDRPPAPTTEEVAMLASQVKLKAKEETPEAKLQRELQELAVESELIDLSWGTIKEELNKLIKTKKPDWENTGAILVKLKPLGATPKPTVKEAYESLTYDKKLEFLNKVKEASKP